MRIIITKALSIQKQEITLCFEELPNSISPRVTKHFQIFSWHGSRADQELTWNKPSQGDSKEYFQILRCYIVPNTSSRHIK